MSLLVLLVGAAWLVAFVGLGFDSTFLVADAHAVQSSFIADPGTTMIVAVISLLWGGFIFAGLFTFPFMVETLLPKRRTA